MSKTSQEAVKEYRRVIVASLMARKYSQREIQRLLAGGPSGDKPLHRNPDTGKPWSLGTINGDVRLYFQPGLSADFYLKTMNGEVFTDFEVDALPGKTEKTHDRNGKNVYMIARMSGVRAGRGGPEIELNTLNGDMFILSR